MKRSVAAAIASAIAASVIWVSAPAAHADWPTECAELRNPPVGTVVVDTNTLQIRIRPSEVLFDASWLYNDVLMCLENDMVLSQLLCFAFTPLGVAGEVDPTNLDLWVVYQDPETGDIVIDGGRAVGTLTGCLAP